MKKSKPCYLDWDKVPDFWVETRMLTEEEVIKEYGDYLGEDGIKMVKKMYKDMKKEVCYLK